MIYVVAPYYQSFKYWCQLRGIKVGVIMEDVYWIKNESSIIGRLIYPEDKIYYEHLSAFDPEKLKSIELMMLIST